MRLAHVSMVLLALIPTFADTHRLDKEKGAATLESAATNGIELPIISSVHDSVGVTPVLLTQSSVRRLFGAKIANVKGKQLVNTKNCSGGQILKFPLLRAGQTTGICVDRKSGSPTEAILTLPLEAKTGDWSVKLQGTDDKAAVKLNRN